MELRSLYPTLNRALILPLETDDKTPSGIVVPENVETVSLFKVGLVVHEGSGRQTDHGVFIEPLFRRGDMVLYYKKSGVPVKVNGIEVRVMPEHEIIGHCNAVLYGGLTKENSSLIDDLLAKVQPAPPVTPSSSTYPEEG